MNYLFQCNNEDCQLAGGRNFIFEAAVPTCPKCEQGPPFTSTVVIMHYVYYNKKGPIKGYAGRRISVACMPDVNIQVSPFQATTGHQSLVNCPKCRASEIFKRMYVPDPSNIHSFFDNPNLDKTKTDTNIQ